jgi:hypothetical protein
MRKFFLIMCVIGIAMWYYKKTDVVVEVDAPVTLAFDYSDNVSINRPPIQKPLKHKVPYKYEEYDITPVATFQLEARVLGSKHYRVGREADLSPVDLALGWGMMSKDHVLGEIAITQSNRFYYWRVQQFPVPQKVIETSSANMHMIAANEAVRDALFNAKTGDVVKLKGFLVSINSDDGWSWKSSMTRNDTGKGACEVILVDDFRIMQL